MKKTYKSVKQIWQSIMKGGYDEFREANPFSEDMRIVHDNVLFKPHRFVSDSQRIETLELWLQKNQPCLFGKMAAAHEAIHFCLIHEDELSQSDEQLSKKIRASLLNWKRHSFDPSVSHAKHGFLLVVYGPNLAQVVRSDDLKDLAYAILRLWACEREEAETGEVFFETLYLKRRDSEQIVRFRFSVDFFMAQGDKRWFHDHRFPGGLAFTANSVGHMRFTREWYDNLQQQEEWSLKTAMQTIAAAAKTDFGKATELVNLKEGKPRHAESKCPFYNTGKLPDSLQNKDWTIYHGYHHTDHSIRWEFFHQDEGLPREIKERKYIEDFTYLYDANKDDHMDFVTGRPVTKEEVIEKLEGKPEDWPTVAQKTEKRKTETPIAQGPMIAQDDYDQCQLDVEKALEKMRQEWKFKGE